MLASGRTPDPEDLPPALDWEAAIWQIFEAIATQWRVSMSGAIGLDYMPAIAIIQARGYSLERSLELLQHIERVVLASGPTDPTTNEGPNDE